MLEKSLGEHVQVEPSLKISIYLVTFLKPINPL